MLCTGVNGMIFRGFGGQILPNDLTSFLRSAALWAGRFTSDRKQFAKEFVKFNEIEAKKMGDKSHIKPAIGLTLESEPGS